MSVPSSRRVFVVGPLPPPVHGQATTHAFLTQHVRAALGALVRVADTSEKGCGRWSAPVVRLSRWLAVFGIVLMRWPRRQRIYLSLSADTGMYLNAAVVALARWTGQALVLHHHTAGHLERPVRPMRWLAAAGGPDALHVTICPAMSRRLRQLYPTIARTAELSNVVQVEARRQPRARRSSSDALVLGMLSNLTFEKGVEEAVATLEALRASGVPVRLVLAGPAGNAAVAAFLGEKRAALGDALRLAGPVYGEAKTAFFDEIDVFVFPSRYRHETQGIVNLEALANGIPVLAYARCCIADDLAAGGGMAVPAAADFVATVLPVLQGYAADRASLAAAAANARKRFEELAVEGRAQLQALMTELADAGGAAPPVFRHPPPRPDREAARRGQDREGTSLTRSPDALG
jgi:glycosyltransferase involved in cell wall biosynthesis